MEGGKRAEAKAAAGPSYEQPADTSENCSIDEEEEHDDDDHDVVVSGFNPGPLVPLREQIEKDKEDESLRRWKEKLLGCVGGELSDQIEPEVKFHSIGIIADDIGEISTPLPIEDSQSDSVLFTLREGSKYRLKMTFTVLHNIVAGLTFTNTVWKGGYEGIFREYEVDRKRGMLGNFGPRREPYTHTLAEETTPSGLLARGIYSAVLKFEDDDQRCHLELMYSFQIKSS